MTKKDILFLLSGGLTNTNPDQSLGGPKSDQTIDNQINNLFSDVTRQQAASGYTDYRCFYIVNNSSDEKLKNFSLYVHKGLEGAEISLGLSLKNDTQALMITGSPIRGSFQLQYTLRHNAITTIQTTREINWTDNIGTMSQRIAAVLNSLDFVGGVQCMGNQSSAGYDFLITFGGSSGGRAQELLSAINQEGIQVFVMPASKGGPINSTAPNIGQDNNPPNGVTFFDTDNLTPVRIGSLFPQDFLPVWLKRTTNKSTAAVHPDQFRLHMFGEPELVLQKVPTVDTKKLIYF